MWRVCQTRAAWPPGRSCRKKQMEGPSVGKDMKQRAFLVGVSHGTIILGNYLLGLTKAEDVHIL